MRPHERARHASEHNVSKQSFLTIVTKGLCPEHESASWKCSIDIAPTTVPRSGSSRMARGEALRVQKPNILVRRLGGESIFLI